MFKKTQTEKTELDHAISAVFDSLTDVEPDSEEYATRIERLSKLYSFREIELKIPHDKLTKDTMLIVGANILGIALIVGHERANVVTSKALNFILKAR